ncbi:MAG TPA: glycoside hydrolase family 172 protein, partial [Armatimonadota bacterium]
MKLSGKALACLIHRKPVEARARHDARATRALCGLVALIGTPLALCCSLATAQGANPAAGMGSPLAGLALPHAGVTRHEGSWDRSGGNGDARGVRPGETLTLLDYKGAGVIRRFWVTIAPRAEKSIHSHAILRMYWDGETTPSVEAPIGDFFGVGLGEQRDFISLPLTETSGGYNCYWPMPFHKSARWTLTNLSNKRIDAFYYNIDFTGYDKLAKDLRHFHAQWNHENPTNPSKNYTILEAKGEGHFVGTALFMEGPNMGFLEGDEMVYVDGETKPSVIGTGTEDYFSSGWYFDRGLYSAPYHGVTLKEEGGGKARVCAYRWHIEDAMPFHKSIKFTIEHGHANEYKADYSSVAYWYQSEPH